MAQRIRKFGVGQTAKVFGILYAMCGLLFLPIAILIMVISPTAGAVFGIGFAIAIPILYGLLGFIMVAIVCALYNVVSGWVGGIELELSDSVPMS